jgi:hypothetical protein
VFDVTKKILPAAYKKTRKKMPKKNVVPSSRKKKKKNDFVSFTLTSKKKAWGGARASVQTVQKKSARPAPPA